MNNLFRVALACVAGTTITASAATFAPANRAYDVKNYRIQLAIDPAQDPKEFDAEVEITLRSTGQLAAVILDREDLTVLSVTTGKPKKKSLAFDVTDPKVVTVALGRLLKKGAETTFTVKYRGKINIANTGFFKVKDNDDASRGPLLFTQFESMSARQFFPCNDEPYDKATTEMLITVPTRYQVVSNGRQVHEKPVRRDGKDWKEVYWKMDQPHSTYLTSLAIAPFGKVTQMIDGKEISVWVGPNKIEQARYSLDVTGQAYRFFEEYTGVKYPWPKYATVGLPTFLWGGMENTSATHMNEERTLLIDPRSEIEKMKIVGLASHELAHQWFGDYVTMKWWDDLWLNESFASLMQTLATQHIFKNEEARLRVVLDAWDEYFRQEDGPRSHAIVDKTLTSADDAFDSINYDKGENVLWMLRAHVGDAKFRQGVKMYLQNHGYANATYIDFFAALEKASGESLSKFRDSWLLQRGYPIVTYGGEWDKKAQTYRLRLEQRPNHPEDKSLFTFRMPVVFHRRTEPAYDQERIVDFTVSTAELVMALPAEPEWVTVNPGSVVLAKVMPQKRDEDILELQALKDPDAITRAWAGYALMDDLLEGKRISTQAQNTLLGILRTDTSPYVRIAILQGFQRMKTRWLPDRLADGLFDLGNEAVHGVQPRTIASTDDTHGWTRWRAELLGTLGRVNKKEVLPHLALSLGRADLPLDELDRTAHSVATLGDERSPAMLKSALKLHQHRGYKYQFAIQYAFGALESPAAAAEIRELSLTCGSDFMGRLGWVVRDNQTLKNSQEWAQFLQEFVLGNQRFGDEVKARILQTIEDVKNTYVQTTLENIVRQSPSDRLKDVSKRILEKNFTGQTKAR